ncbi:MAG TPA: subclass B3 metallo-beta-lactamase [Bryobacteraceae bacterium]|nr:subclass B3 metallo-beta-lactamase [Bryobacteraceae bacterium]
MTRFLAATVALASLAPVQARAALFPPLRIIGNVYYVGDDDLASFLITTPKGDILINNGFEYSAEEIRARMKMLGFKITDIKILLVTHAHSDHAAATATLKRITGAKLMAIEQETELLETGGRTDYLFGSSGWFPPAKVDRQFKDGDRIELGGSSLTAHLTPGHTKGSVSYSMDVAEGGRTYHVLIANLGSINPGTEFLHNDRYPKIREDYAATFRIQKELACDVFLTSHASQFGLLAKWKPGMPYDPERFVDPEGYHRAVERLEQRFLETVQAQRDEDQAARDYVNFKKIPQDR